jgi:catechol 2,3-dioxygenase-like lactoylglutathione lyase family enzyme
MTMTDTLTTHAQQAFRLQGVSHVSIQVRDLDRALRFYSDFLGLHVWLRFEEQYTWKKDGEDHVGTRRTVFLRLEPGLRAPFFVLGEYGEDGPPPGSNSELGDLGIDHFAFAVDDVTSLQERAREAGVDIVKPVVIQDAAQFGFPQQGAVKTIMLRDPEGNYIQVDEYI